MKKVTMIHNHHFFVECPCNQVYRIVGVATAAGAELCRSHQERDNY
jgi:hypothetical protein